ncbi:MAG: winged helix-turn-helix domain-containing protein [Alphaproteobacteria bacterium]|nr:MAG: hypothetical protein B6I23_02775 [Rickettsiaceae bacterium 4572_127]
MYSINAEFNKIFKAICYKTRTDILSEIASNNKLTLTELSKKFKMKTQTLDFHIQKLKDVGIIKSKRQKGSILLVFNKKKVDNAIVELQKAIG